MLTQDVEFTVERCGYRDEAPVRARLPSVYQAAKHEIDRHSALRGTVALFTDSRNGMGGLVAKSLVRDGYAVRLYETSSHANPIPHSEKASCQRSY